MEPNAEARYESARADLLIGTAFQSRCLYLIMCGLEECSKL